MPKHQLTPEERLRGSITKRERREAAEERALEKLDDVVLRAAEALAEAMEAERFKVADGVAVPIGPAHVTRIKAAALVLDRVLGRATQRTEISGSVDLNIEYRARLASLLADRATRAKASNGS